MQQKNRPLIRGDSIGIVAPSFWMEKENIAKEGFLRIKELGFNIVFGDEVFKKFNYSTDTPQKRAESINKMFANPSIKAIICLDGGCASLEVLPYLDYKLISSNHKIFSGFSDVSHINLALMAKSSLKSLYGFDIVNGFGRHSSNNKYSIGENFFLDITSKKSTRKIIPGKEEWEVWRSGSASGVLIGGWLEALNNLKDTDFFPDNDEVILFWETVDCEINKINSMINSLKASRFWNSIKGMIIGKLSNCQEKEYFDCFPSLKEILLESTKKEGFPIVANVGFGHNNEIISLPIGLKAQMSVLDNDREIKIMEDFVNE